MARQRSTHTQSALQTHDITSEHNWSRKSGVRTQQLMSTARKVMGSLAGRDPGLLAGEAEQTGTGRSRLGQRSPGFPKPWI